MGGARPTRNEGGGMSKEKQLFAGGDELAASEKIVKVGFSSRHTKLKCLLLAGVQGDAGKQHNNKLGKRYLLAAVRNRVVEAKGCFFN